MLRPALTLLLSLLLLGTNVFGAEDEAPAATDAEAEATPAEAASPGDVDAAMAEEIRAAEEAAANAPSTNTDESFVPSVQISEDLSVSFPVDI